MTIKPVISQKSGEKKENHGHQEPQNQNIVVQNARSNHRSVVINNKTNVEGQSPQRRDVFEDIARHRRSPHKSGNRSKRDHHKREQRDREKVCPSPQYHQVLSSSNSPHSSSSNSHSCKSPKHVAIPTGTPSATQTSNNNLMAVVEETFSGYNSGDEHLMSKENLLTPDEWKNRDEAFIKSMSENGFVIKDIVEDGACLFRAISLQIYGDQEMHEVIRQQTMDYIYQNREYFAHFVTEDINSYVTRKRNKDSHGNHIEIQAMSEIYNRPVELYCYKTTPINIFNSQQKNNGHDPLRLSYQRGSHYNAIVDPYNASVGVGLGLAGYKPESQTHEAIRLSEQLEIEQTMFEDKLKTTDWEATNEAIEEQIARESYLQWCRENMQNAQKASSNSTSSTVTSAEANSSFSSCGSTSFSETNTPDTLQQYHGTNISDDKNIIQQTSLIPITQQTKTNCSNNNDVNSSEHNCIDSDDTDISSSSSVEYVDKMLRFNNKNKTKTSHISRRLKRRRRDIEKKDESTESEKLLQSKRSKQNIRLDNLTSLENNTTEIIAPQILNTSCLLPCTSKQADESKPVSKFYQSLLESSYTDDGIGQLSENEMVQKAIQMSRMDFIDEQRRKFCLDSYETKDGGDEDSDTPYM